MLSIDSLEQLRTAYNPHTAQTPEEICKTVGEPSGDEIVAAALEYSQSADRNVRALALRILAHFDQAASRNGILRGLTDPERRVRDVAVQSSVRFVQHSPIAAQLGAMATDMDEKRKIRERALNTLLGIGAPIRSGPLPQAVVTVIEPLLARAEYRARILHGLVQIDGGDVVDRLLGRFIEEGSPEEAAMTKYALSGFRMVNIGHYEEGPERERILKECKLASGRVYYWVPRNKVHE